MAVLRGSFLSTELGRHNSFSIILPHDVLEEPQWGFPVLYLLHGKSDDCQSWLFRSGIERYAQEFGIAVVMPDIGISWCTDTIFGGNYFSYVTKELPEVVGNMFRLSVRREDTYIGGISMGGYGALKAVLTMPEKYAGCIALSAVADIGRVMAEQVREGTNKAMWKAVLGESLRLDAKNDLFQLTEMIGGYANICPKIHLVCGSRDEFFDDNVRLKGAFDKYKIDHAFTKGDAGHEWGFWDAALHHTLGTIFKRR